jgi:hypothetical protein
MTCCEERRLPKEVAEAWKSEEAVNGFHIAGKGLATFF